jgi:hypothetical protein
MPVKKRKLLHDSDNDYDENPPAFEEREVTRFKNCEKCQSTHSFGGKPMLKLPEHLQYFLGSTWEHQPQVCYVNIYTVPQEEL